jgi:AcrR family transcriptional regulator
MPSSRDKILVAAARVYAEQGFRGATTRRIADEAGVNEITVFRHFGSKDALIHEALRVRAVAPSGVELPDEPRDPERELTAWAMAEIADMRSCRTLIRRTMSEMGERPEVVECTSAGPLDAKERLCSYVARLRRDGFVAAIGNPVRQREWDEAAVAMLMGALFSDAMGRDVMPGMFPVSAERAPAMYVRIFLRAVGVGHAASTPRPAPAARRASKHTTGKVK